MILRNQRERGALRHIQDGVADRSGTSDRWIRPPDADREQGGTTTMAEISFFCANPLRQRKEDNERITLPAENAVRNRGWRRIELPFLIGRVSSLTLVCFQYGVVGGGVNRRSHPVWKRGFRTGWSK